jgi:outer membrane receptor protein involved in Fe transport
MKRSRNKLYQFVAAACLPISLTAQAQLEEVIVTAQKRAENLQDVPISITALQGKQIQDATIQNLAAIADYVPNLHIAEAAVNTNIYMRGVGSGNNRGFEQSVGMYVDGVYLGRARQFRSGLLDIERVEALRGPQGTLFGKNTVAGAINITTASPTVGTGIEGEINAAFEEFGGANYEGYVQGGADTFAMRLAVKHRETDGYVYNAYLGEDEGQIEETGGRLTLVWEPSDTFSANFKYSYHERERIGAPSATYRYLSAEQRAVDVPITTGNPLSPASQAYAMTDIFFPGIYDAAGAELTTYKDNNFGLSKDDGLAMSDRRDSNDDTIENTVLTLTWDVGAGTVTSVTGYSTYEYIDDVDVDWLPLSFLARYDDHEFEQFSQEIRFTSDTGGRFDYTVGAYYDENELDMFGRVTFDLAFDGLYPQFTQLALGAPLPNFLFASSFGANIPALGVYGADQVARNHGYLQDSESLALFAQGTYELSDVLRLTVGVRYTEEEKDVVTDQRLGDTNCGLDGNFQEGPGCTGNYNAWLDIFFSNYPFDSWNYSYVASRKTDSVDPSVNLQWDVSDSSMLYVSYSSGFKSGGFTAADDGRPGDAVGALVSPPPTGGVPGALTGGYVYTTPNEDFEFDDESVDAFEIGGKHEFANGSVRLNWAAFYSTYDDLQTSIFRGAGFTVKNAASSEVMGLEVDAIWQITDALRVGGNVAYLDATYDDFSDGPCTAIQLDGDNACGSPAGSTSNDLSGAATLYASDYSGSLFVDFRRPLGALEFFAGAEVNYRDAFNSAGDNDPIDMIDSYTKVNARIGIGGEYWEIMAYGRNIFDEIAFQQSFDTPLLSGSHTRFMEEPAVFGVRGTFRF